MSPTDASTTAHRVDALVAWQIGRGRVVSLALLAAVLTTPLLAATGTREEGTTSALGVFGLAGQIDDVLRDSFIESNPAGRYLVTGAVLLVIGVLLSVVGVARVTDLRSWVSVVTGIALACLFLGSIATWGGATSFPDAPVGVAGVEVRAVWGLWIPLATVAWIGHLRLLVLMLRSPDLPVRRFGPS